MNERNMLPSPREAAFLNILSDKKRYGREIRDEYEKRTGHRISLAAVYVALGRMVRAELVVSSMGETTPERGSHRRKYYEITGIGERALSSFEEFVLRTSGGRLRCVTG